MRCLSNTWKLWSTYACDDMCTSPRHTSWWQKQSADSISHFYKEVCVCKQPAGVGSLLSPCRLRESNSDCQACSKHSDSMNHLSIPLSLFFFCDRASCNQGWPHRGSPWTPDSPTSTSKVLPHPAPILNFFICACISQSSLSYTKHFSSISVIRRGYTKQNQFPPW